MPESDEKQDPGYSCRPLSHSSRAGIILRNALKDSFPTLENIRKENERYAIHGFTYSIQSGARDLLPGMRAILDILQDDHSVNY